MTLRAWSFLTKNEIEIEIEIEIKHYCLDQSNKLYRSRTNDILVYFSNFSYCGLAIWLYFFLSGPLIIDFCVDQHLKTNGAVPISLLIFYSSSNFL